MKNPILSQKPFFQGVCVLLLVVLGGSVFGCREQGKADFSPMADSSEISKPSQADEEQPLLDGRDQTAPFGENEFSEKAPTSEETGFPLDGMAVEVPLKHDENGEKSKSVDEEAEESVPEFGEGEDFNVATPENSSISQEELDKYIEDDEYMFEPLKLEEPYFENSAELVRLHPDKPVWIDKNRENIVLQGWICQTKVMLEFFLCQGSGGIRTFPYDDETGKPAKMLMFNGTKCHESVACTEVPGHVIHAALLALGAEPGQPVQFQPDFKAPTGEEIEVTIRWKKEDGSIAEYRAQELILDTEGKKMSVPWVFAGSLFYEDGEGEKRYAADMEGEFIAVSNFPSVILDVPAASTNVNSALTYVANEKILPERGAPITIILSRIKTEF